MGEDCFLAGVEYYCSARGHESNCSPLLAQEHPTAAIGDTLFQNDWDGALITLRSV